MLWHAISPVLGTGRRSGGLVGSRRMNSDAKIIVLYMESLPSVQRPRVLGPLSDFARDAGVKGGPYKKAKKFLKREGFLHEWRYRRPGGLWATAQILSNAPSTRQQAEAYWESCSEYLDAEETELDEEPVCYGEVVSPQVAPGDHFRAVGSTGPWSVGDYPPHVQLMGNSSSLPTRAVCESKAERTRGASEFGTYSQFAAEDGEGFWAEPPEWLGEEDSEGDSVKYFDKYSEDAFEGPEEWEPGPVVAAVVAPVALPAYAPVPVSVPERVPVAVPVLAPVAAPVPARVAASVPEPVAAPVAVSQGEPLARRAFEVVEAERVLLSLRRGAKQLTLGVREARVLVDLAAEWLRRGVPAAELRETLVSWLPEGGVYSPVGFLRYRLQHKMPADRAHLDALADAASGAPRGRSSGAVSNGASRPQGVDEEPPPYVPPAPLVTCEGPGDEHVFRAVGGETKCGQCRSAEAWEAYRAHRLAAALARGEDGLVGDGKGGRRDVLAGLVAPPGSEYDPGEEAAAYAALGL
ncbi:hypothetical protein [Streptomyces sp. NBC_00102]|uniref:hypothetical protein n=1 Tax=Streptomyces sp. NBC_00102 TaxID=2975652 RepID=UPI002B1E2575|nr:hypothetical protein [Streptomyces sp. NBC_00102]